MKTYETNVIVRCSFLERKYLKINAKKANKTPSEFIRARTMRESLDDDSPEPDEGWREVE